MDLARDRVERPAGRWPVVPASVWLCVVLDLAEVDQHASLIADRPGIVSRWDRDRVTRAALAFASVIHDDVHPSGEHVPEVRRLAGSGVGDRLDVLRPTPPRLEHASAHWARTEIHDAHSTLL